MMAGRCFRVTEKEHVVYFILTRSYDSNMNLPNAFGPIEKIDDAVNHAKKQPPGIHRIINGDNDVVSTVTVAAPEVSVEMAKDA